MVDVSPVYSRSGGVRGMKCAEGDVEPAADAYHDEASPPQAKKPPEDAGVAAKEWLLYRVRYELEDEVGGASPGCPLEIFCEQVLPFHIRQPMLSCYTVVWLYRGSCTRLILRNHD